MADNPQGPSFWPGFTYGFQQPPQSEPQFDTMPGTSNPGPEPVIADHPASLIQNLERDEVLKVQERKAMICHYCNQLIHKDDPSIELFIGICGPSPKSGRLMTMEDPREIMNPTVNLHPECVSAYAYENLEVSEHHFEPQFCARCEEQIDIDE